MSEPKGNYAKVWEFLKAKLRNIGDALTFNVFSGGTGLPWMDVALKDEGIEEVKGVGGKSNNETILGWAKDIGGWVAEYYKEDSIPWGGLGVTHAMEVAGIEVKLTNPLGAKQWLNFGIPCEPRYGAIMVFENTGGGQVGFYVSEDQDTYHIYGYNQDDTVKVKRFDKEKFLGARWPEEHKDLMEEVGGRIVKKFDGSPDRDTSNVIEDSELKPDDEGVYQIPYTEAEVNNHNKTRRSYIAGKITFDDRDWTIPCGSGSRVLQSIPLGVHQLGPLVRSGPRLTGRFNKLFGKNKIKVVNVPNRYDNKIGRTRRQIQMHPALSPKKIKGERWLQSAGCVAIEPTRIYEWLKVYAEFYEKNDGKVWLTVVPIKHSRKYTFHITSKKPKYKD